MFSGLKVNKSRLRLIAALVILLACGVLILYLCIFNLLGPVGGSPLIEDTIQVSPGMSAMEIGDLLEKKGIC